MGRDSEVSPFGVVNIRAEHDVAGELQLSPPQCRMLETLAKHGGEMPFSWDDLDPARKPPIMRDAVYAAQQALVDLINDGYVLEREYVTSALQVRGRMFLRLTDKGRSVMSELEKFRLVPDSMKAISAEEIHEEISKS